MLADSTRPTEPSRVEPPRVALFGMHLHALALDHAVALIRDWGRERDAPLRYVVTPNVQHAVLFQKDPEFRRAYAQASLVLADGTPLIWASRWLGSPLPERVAGSDLLPSLLRSASPERPLSIYLLGAAPEVADRAARSIERQFPAVCVKGVYSPPFGFEHDDRENCSILQRVADASPELLVIGLGAPKQELWVHRFQAELRARVALCAGATIDFMAGAKPRAPQWMRGAGLEWLHRLHSEPRRLAPRYASDALQLPRLLVREWIERRKPQ